MSKARSVTEKLTAPGQRPRGHRLVTNRTEGQIMGTEMLSYSQLADRLNCSPEAARSLVKRLRLPRQKANDGKVLVSVDLSEINHKPIPARSPADVGAHAHEHSPPVPVVNVKVVLNDPAISDLKMPSVRDLIANSNHDARRLAPFEDHYDCVRLGLFEIWIDEIVTTALRRLHDRDVALGRSLLHPVLKLVGDVGQGVPCHRV